MESTKTPKTQTENAPIKNAKNAIGLGCLNIKSRTKGAPKAGNVIRTKQPNADKAPKHHAPNVKDSREERYSMSTVNMVHSANTTVSVALEKGRTRKVRVEKAQI